MILLNDEQNEDAQWVLGNYFLTGKPGVVPANQKNAVTSIDNAARKGHVEAARWMGMAHWMGTHGVEANRGLGLGYMRIAARFGDPDSTLLVRSMELQPERDRIAAQRREDARIAAEREQRSWFAKWADAIAANASRSSTFRTGISASQRAANQGWQNSQAAMDRLHFRQRMEYLTGASTACNRSNPYC